MPPGERSTVSSGRRDSTTAPSPVARTVTAAMSSTARSGCAPPAPPTACVARHASAPSASRVLNSPRSPHGAEARVAVTAAQKAVARSAAAAGRSMKAYVQRIMALSTVRGGPGPPWCQAARSAARLTARSPGASVPGIPPHALETCARPHHGKEGRGRPPLLRQRSQAGAGRALVEPRRPCGRPWTRCTAPARAVRPATTTSAPCPPGTSSPRSVHTFVHRRRPGRRAPERPVLDGRPLGRPGRPAELPAHRPAQPRTGHRSCGSATAAVPWSPYRTPVRPCRPHTGVRWAGAWGRTAAVFLSLKNLRARPLSGVWGCGSMFDYVQCLAVRGTTASSMRTTP